MKSLLAAALLAFTSTSAQAVAAVTNLNLPGAGGGWVLSPTIFIGMSFTVGNGAPSWSFQSADLRLGTETVGSPIVSVGLYADSGGSVGTFIADLSSIGVALGTSTYNSTPLAPVTFTAGSTYWLVLSSSDNSHNTGWDVPASGSLAQSGEPGWTIKDGAAVSDNGGGQLG